MAKNKPEKESVAVQVVEGLNGQKLVETKMVISYGKLLSLLTALNNYESPVAQDLHKMFTRAGSFELLRSNGCII